MGHRIQPLAIRYGKPDKTSALQLPVKWLSDQRCSAAPQCQVRLDSAFGLTLSDCKETGEKYKRNLHRASLVGVVLVTAKQGYGVNGTSHWRVLIVSEPAGYVGWPV